MDKFASEYQKLNPRQRQAVDNTEGPVLVIAGPGTGKTQLLTTRVAAILQKTDAQPQNILCLTFTESAAYEMRQRLVNIIGQMAYNVTISTYHAFGSELIRRFPEYFTDTTDKLPIDELGQHTIIEAIITDLPYANPLKKANNYTKDIISTISDFRRELLSPDAIKAVAQANLKVIQQLNHCVQIQLDGIARITKKNIAQFEKLAKDTKQFAKKQYVKPRILSLGYQWQNSLEQALSNCAESGKTNALTTWKNSWLIRDAESNFTVDGLVVNTKLTAVADLYQTYLEQLDKNGYFDYDDMILRAIRGLEEHAELRYSLQEQYMYILLDEFQDTNAAQLQLVQLLSDNPIYEGRPNVLAVGDDDQAIYAFQGANYSHMLTFKDMYRDVALISLTHNYRSHPDVLHLAHGITEQIDERLNKHMREINKLLSAESRQLPKQASVERHEFKSDVSQFAWITKQIGDLLKKGTKANEIAILAPRHRYLEPLVPYLSKANIPVRYEKREDVLEDVGVLQLIQMAQLVAFLHDQDFSAADSIWPEVLSYDFWSLPTEKIWQLSWRAYKEKASWTNLLIQDHSTKQIALFFVQLANLASLETLETMLDYLIGINEITLNKKPYRSPFYDFNFGSQRQHQDLGSFWSLLSNLTVLRQHLREYYTRQNKVLQLNDLIKFAEDHKRAAVKVLNTSPYHESAEAVQIMTAYKAKGMEFEHVFIVACVDEVWGSKVSSQMLRVPLPQNLNFVRYQGSNNDERLRLFFVALTRAKHGLYLTSYQTNYANRPTSRLKFLNEVEDGDKLLSQLLPKPNQQVNQSNETAPSVEELANYWQLRHLNARKQPKLQDLLKHKLDVYQLAPTHLNRFTDLVYGGPQNFFLTTILKFPRAQTVDSEFGTTMHEVIEWIQLENKNKGHLPSKTAIVRTFDKKLRQKQLNVRDTALLLERGRHALDKFVPQRHSTFKVENEHEFNFRNQSVFVGHAHLTGKIDKLIINKKDRSIIVVDYKTGSSHKKWDRNNPKLHKYRQQLYIYKLLVEGSYQFADYHVKEAYIEFVEPDENGKIIQLPLTFDFKEIDRMKKLIGSAWEHIKHLDFPDTNNYRTNMQGISEFENDLIDRKI